MSSQILNQKSPNSGIEDIDVGTQIKKFSNKCDHKLRVENQLILNDLHKKKLVIENDMAGIKANVEAQRYKNIFNIEVKSKKYIIFFTTLFLNFFLLTLIIR